MHVGAWIALYVVTLGFWVWVAVFGGADRIEGSPLADWLHFSPEGLSADTLRGLAWVMIVGETIWFVLGLTTPAARFV